MTADLEITRLRESGGKGFEKVFAFLRERLLAGSMRPGDRLIPERDLAAQLGVWRENTAVDGRRLEDQLRDPS